MRNVGDGRLLRSSWLWRGIPTNPSCCCDYEFTNESTLSRNREVRVVSVYVTGQCRVGIFRAWVNPAPCPCPLLRTETSLSRRSFKLAMESGNAGSKCQLHYFDYMFQGLTMFLASPDDCFSQYNAHSTLAIISASH